jgi:thiol-disulfide isomerase/thioredoxin
MKYAWLLIVLLGQCGCREKEVPLRTGMEGKPIPAFNLLLADSTTYFNTANIPTGKQIVLYYFSPSCPYCKAQMTEIIADIKSLKDIQFYIFTSSTFAAFKNFYKRFKLDAYPNIVAGVDYEGFFQDYYKVTGVPYLALYKHNKTLAQVFDRKINTSRFKISYNY